MLKRSVHLGDEIMKNKSRNAVEEAKSILSHSPHFFPGLLYDIDNFATKCHHRFSEFSFTRILAISLHECRLLSGICFSSQYLQVHSFHSE